LAQAALSVQISSVKNKIDDVNKESEQYKELEETVVSLEKGLAGVKEIYDGKNQWTKLLTHLEKATPNDVKYTALKITGNQAEATVEGNDINSLARFVESYQGYQVITLQGTGEPTDTLTISIDGGQADSVTVKSSGGWNYSVNIDPSINHTIKIVSDSKSSDITYTAADKTIKTEGEAVSAQVKNLFTAVDTKEYQKKEDGKVTFKSTFNFEGGLLW
jgi:hypothetical protein